MVNVYDNYLGEMGLPHTCSLIEGIETEKKSVISALAYNNKADKIIWKPRAGEQGKYDLLVIADKYSGSMIRSNAVQSGMASYACEISYEESKNLDEKLDKSPTYNFSLNTL